MIQLSIVTPVYNRASLLKKCYASLLAQTCYDFEWIVVNDGSTDETAELMREIAAERAPFSIRYVEKENGGKHTALNAAHPYIRGKYVLILDSDDTLTEDAAELALRAWERWEKVPELGIVTLLKGKDRDHPNCRAADENTPVDILAYPHICLVSNDACEVIRAELFLANPFPVFPGEKFLAETALWGRVGLTHKCVYVNRVIYLCDYLADGLTRSGRAMRIRNPRGGMFNSNLYMAKKIPLKIRVKNGLLFTCYGNFAQMQPKEMAAECDSRALMRLCLPFGWMLFRYWKKKYD